jgi:hypothetical protein
MKTATAAFIWFLERKAQEKEDGEVLRLIGREVPCVV